MISTFKKKRSHTTFIPNKHVQEEVFRLKLRFVTDSTKLFLAQENIFVDLELNTCFDPDIDKVDIILNPKALTAFKCSKL